MSDPGTFSDGGTGQETEADGVPPYAEPLPSCTEEEAQSAAKQPPLVEGMGIDFNQPETCTDTLTRVSEGQVVGGIPDIIVPLHRLVQFNLIH